MSMANSRKLAAMTTNHQFDHLHPLKVTEPQEVNAKHNATQNNV